MNIVNNVRIDECLKSLVAELQRHEYIGEAF